MLQKQDGNNETEEEVKTCGVEYCGIQWCDGYGMLLLLLAFVYIGLFYYLVKRLWGKKIWNTFLGPLQKLISRIFKFR